MTDNRLPLYYTFGNHMHWVDMEWLWGYAVLPGSVRDMLYFCAETGAKGNINFDGIGYEKMAAEAPDALAELRDAIARGQAEHKPARAAGASDCNERANSRIACNATVVEIRPHHALIVPRRQRGALRHACNDDALIWSPPSSGRLSSS